VAATLAPATVGVPTRVSPSPLTRSTRSKVMVEPASTGSFSTETTSPTLTRYCLPPVSMIA
jgi:hypothetical protein